MKSPVRILAFDLFVLLLCGLGVYRASQTAQFPAELETKSGNVVVSRSLIPQLQAGDSIASMDGNPTRASTEIALLCDEDSVGQMVSVNVIRGQDNIPLTIPLAQQYPVRKLVTECFAAFLYFFLGVAVILFQRSDRGARVFHHLSVSIASLIFLTTGRFTLSPFGWGYAFEIFFRWTYLLVPPLFLHFTLIFPRERFRFTRRILWLSYSAAVMIGLWATIAFVRVAFPHIDLRYFPMFDTAEYATLLFFAAEFFAGFGILLYSLFTAKEVLERRKLRWIVFGILFGANFYIALQLIPEILFGHGISEELAILLSVVAPISFSIAILRFKVFNIDLFLKRSTAYTLAIGLFVGCYLLLIFLVTPLLVRLEVPSYWSNVLGALALALVFDPTRRSIQKFIDKKFFHVSYNYFEAQRELVEWVKFSTTYAALSSIVVERLDSLIPVTKIGFFAVESSSDRLKLLAHRNFDVLERRQVTLQTRDLKTGLELPVAISEEIEPGFAFESADREVFDRWNIALVLPMLSAERRLLGFLVLSKKRSGERFLLEDLSLLEAVTAQAGLALERIRIASELILEQAESERLAEVSAMKSFFVSSVSHDLKTPLTSIRLFAEMMKDHPDLAREKEIEYLSIIEGESDRLSRLITNVLDFAKIEKGTKEYSLRPRNLNDIATDVIRSLQYQVLAQGFEVHTALAAEPLSIEADYDAVFDATANLISNAIKYSPAERKRISIVTNHAQNFAMLSVEDSGFGISPTEIERIFDSFYRINDPHTRSTGGAGIGLALVKHTMEAHRGKVEVTSELGKGSNFVLYFPLVA